MKTYLSAMLIGLAVVTIGILIYPSEKPEKPIQFSAKKTGRKIIYNPSELFVKPGVKMKATQGLKQLEGMNAYIVEPNVKTFSVIPKGWEISDEQEYSIEQFSCECKTCTPTPGPGVSPGPIPTPIEADASWGRARVEARAAMGKADTSAVKVCVVDTGIDLQHPNKGSVIGTQDFSGKGTAQDGQGHGTHTAGTIAGTGGVGVSRARLLICKGLSDAGSGTSSSLAQCLTWCGQQGAQIISNSWGSSQPDGLINNAIIQLTQRGIGVVISNGNDGEPNLNWPAALSESYPLVFGSAASDQNNQKAIFSNYGPGTKFISPGVNIVSNRPGGGVATMSGTSMSAPHLSGILAFCVAKQKPLATCVKSSMNIQGYQFANAKLTAEQP